MNPKTYIVPFLDSHYKQIRYVDEYGVHHVKSLNYFGEKLNKHHAYILNKALRKISLYYKLNFEEEALKWYFTESIINFSQYIYQNMALGKEYSVDSIYQEYFKHCINKKTYSF